MNQTIEDLRDKFGCAVKACDYHNYDAHDGSCCNKSMHPWFSLKCYKQPNLPTSKPTNKLNTKQVTITINITADGEIL